MVYEGKVQQGGHVGVGIGNAPGRNEEGIFEKQKMKTHPLCEQKAGRFSVGIHNSVVLKKEVMG